MTHDDYSAEYIRGILQTVKTIALVGASNTMVRPSYFVLTYLIDKGYEVIPVSVPGCLHLKSAANAFAFSSSPVANRSSGALRRH